jgi:hypothetical protein
MGIGVLMIGLTIYKAYLGGENLRKGVENKSENA